MAKQKKEGRGKDLPTDIPSETQRMMIRDIHDFRITGVNAFDPSTYESKQFHQSRDEYKKHGYAVFLTNVEGAARSVRSHMKQSEISEAKKRAKEAEKNRKAQQKKAKISPGLYPSRASSILASSSPPVISMNRL